MTFYELKGRLLSQQIPLSSILADGARHFLNLERPDLARRLADLAIAGGADA
jgi:hypothetical protein